MKIISSQENKKIILDLLTYFDRICRENSIEYSLSGGSLLGAVRHKGFIPWDDDGDVMMTRKNYEKLKIILNQKKDARFGFMDETTEGYYYAFSKLYLQDTILKPLTVQDREIKNLGVYIDIFPIDKIPAEKNEQNEYCEDLLDTLYNMYMTIPGFYYQDNNFVKGFLKYFLRFPRYKRIVRIESSTKKWQSLVIQKLMQFDNTDASFGGFLLSEYKKKEIVPFKTFEYYTDIDFAGKKFRSIVDFDGYLSALYGNYMVLPQKKNRVAKHAYVEYWK